MIKLRNNLVYGCRVRDAQLCKDVSIQKIHVILIVIIYKTAILCSLVSGYESKSKSCVARKKQLFSNLLECKYISYSGFSHPDMSHTNKNWSGGGIWTLHLVATSQRNTI
jgi:hypothetical protein